jgi:predicted dinucleotide-binding enzyme
MGRGIGTRVVAGGNQVEIVDRDPTDAQKLAGELGDRATALDNATPLSGDVVVFAVYYPGIKDAVRNYADQLTGKVVVDITNPADIASGTVWPPRRGAPRPRRSRRSSRRARPWSKRST